MDTASRVHRAAIPSTPCGPRSWSEPSDGRVTGEIVLDRPAMVGEGITGTIRLAAVDRFEARKAALRLVGLRLDEVTRSRDDHDADGRVTHSEHWVETNGNTVREGRVPGARDPGAL